MDAPRRPAEPAGAAALAVAAACAARLAIDGYAFGISNHSIQVPHLRWLQDPSLFPGDRLVEAMQGYFSFFWPLMAWLTGRLPLEPTFYAIHLLTLLAFTGAVFAITRRVFPEHPLAPYLALWLVLWGDAAVGVEPLYWVYLTHTPVATALGLWSVWCVLSGRWLAGCALAGLVFDVHAMQSAYLVLMIAAASLQRTPREWRRQAKGAALYALVALPGLVWMLRSSALAAPEGFARLLRLYFPKHFYASSFEASEWLALAITLLLLGAARRWAPGGEGRRGLERMCGAILLLWLVGGALGEWWPLAAVLKLHVFRASSYFTTFALILFAGVLARAWQQRPGPRALAGALALCTIAVVGSLRFLDLSRPAVAWPLVGAGLAGATAAVLRGRARTASALAALACLLWVAGLHAVQRARFADHYPFAVARLRSSDWFAVQRWAREHSQPGDLFLTPPDTEGFRIYAERPVVGEWKDGAAALWDAAFAVHWLDWYQRVGGRLDDDAREPIYARLARGWYALGQRGIESLARAVGARFIVIRAPSARERADGARLAWRGEALFQSGPYFVVRAPGSAPERASLR